MMSRETTPFMLVRTFGAGSHKFRDLFAIYLVREVALLAATLLLHDHSANLSPIR